tara:strand:+ start:2201 stop:2704 length:504 start_codon:yes stop_codon:yes gene_type:complete
MKGKEALASARRSVARLEEQNDKLLTRVKALEAQLKVANKESKDRSVLASEVESLRKQRDEATSEELVKAKRRANKAIKIKDEVQAELASIKKKYHKLCEHYINQAGGGPEGVDALVKFLSGSDAIVAYYTEKFTKKHARVATLVERMRRKKARAFSVSSKVELKKR